MFEVITLLAVVVAVFMGFSIGSSAVPPSFGPVRSSGLMGVLRSALLAGIAAAIGAVIQGGNVASRIGTGIVPSGFTNLQAVIILSVASILVVVSFITSYPMPTAFTVVGSVIGTSLGFGTTIDYSSVAVIIGYWLMIPFMAILIGFIVSKLLVRFFDRDNSKKLMRYLTFFMGLFVAYNAGANSVGKAVGPLAGLGFSDSFLLVLGSFSILLGALILSPKIVAAVSFEYSNIGPRKSVAGLSTAAFLAQIGVLFGVPISFNQAIIASIIGSGMVSGDAGIGSKKLTFTVIAWVTAFILAIILTFLISSTLQFIL